MKLWATTKTDSFKVKIYINPEITWDTWAWTYTRKGETWIELNPALFKASGHKFDSILMHEFVHACEYIYARKLRRKNPKDCTQHAMVLGDALPQLLRNLKQTSR